MIVSILIPSLLSRMEMLESLIDVLIKQLDNETFFHESFIGGSYCIDVYRDSLVEIIIDTDNKQASTGEKRNRLINQAAGEYIIFIDDDDIVPPYYIEQLLLAAKSGSDCFAINGTMTTDGAKEIKWKISKDYENVTVKENSKDVYLRKTNHITAVKRELALLAPFPDKSNAEDKAYSDKLNIFLKSEFIISLPMYHYRFSTKNKEY